MIKSVVMLQFLLLSLNQASQDSFRILAVAKDSSSISGLPPLHSLTRTQAAAALPRSRYIWLEDPRSSLVLALDRSLTQLQYVESLTALFRIIREKGSVVSVSDLPPLLAADVCGAVGTPVDPAQAKVVAGVKTTATVWTNGEERQFELSSSDSLKEHPEVRKLAFGSAVPLLPPSKTPPEERPSIRSPLWMSQADPTICVEAGRRAAAYLVEQFKKLQVLAMRLEDPSIQGSQSAGSGTEMPESIRRKYLESLKSSSMSGTMTGAEMAQALEGVTKFRVNRQFMIQIPIQIGTSQATVILSMSMMFD